MPRYKLTIEYDGIPFFGWQRQGNGLTIQEVLEKAAFDLCGHAVEVIGAGRTDAGVHARGQVAHIDLPKEYPSFTIQQAFNFHLQPHPIAITRVEEVDQRFHARFSALERTYQYVIVNRSAVLTLDLGRAWWVFRPLKLQSMREAASYLCGQHDFSAFRASQCQSSTAIKTLDELDVRQEGEKFIILARARSFLHHQVRNMVGTLKLVGEGKLAPQKVQEILLSRKRKNAGPTAPACGLYLMSVRYGERKI